MRKISFAPGEIYHLYNRGTDRRSIFQSITDHRRFMLLLYISNSTNSIHLSNYADWQTPGLYSLPREETLVEIGAYCLMPNHFHLLLQEKEEGGISRFMQKLTTGYSMYFNKKRERNGRLFQGTFKSEHVNYDPYLKYLFSYIHLNPLSIVDPRWKENGLKNIETAERHLNEYEFSSLLDYKDRERAESVILDRENYPFYFESKDVSDLLEEMNRWLYESEGNPGEL